jgi:hypothetical protein
MAGRQHDAIAMQEIVADLVDRGVEVVDPRQTYIGRDVDLGRIRPGAVLHPGTRIVGASSFVGPGAHVGAEGPATLSDAVLARGARVDAGYVEGAVLLEGARIGWGGHVRPATLLEEQASTAHCVGLKHTILLAFATIGSVVNACDLLLAGGTSREDHSEIGSGFIHFNFTPWGRRGDKATASLLGDVEDGVFLRRRRIFMGGAGGAVGPRRVGYGAIVGAGQVLRRDVADDRLVFDPGRAVDRELAGAQGLDAPEHLARRRAANLSYIGQLVALAAWYRDVRCARVPSTDAYADTCVVLSEAAAVIEAAIAERVARLEAFLRERGDEEPVVVTRPEIRCPLDVRADEPFVDHLSWVRGLSDDDVTRGRDWLRKVAQVAISA